jgi:hypothetical protein
LTQEQADALAARQRAYHATFAQQYGDWVLRDILGRLGYYERDPAKIRPELVAFGNWLLGQIGVSIDWKTAMDMARPGKPEVDEEEEAPVNWDFIEEDR